MKRNYSEEAIRILSKFPQVKHISKKRFSFTFEYRLELYDVWKSGGNLKLHARNDGIPVCLLHVRTFSSLVVNFRLNGKPKGGKSEGRFSTYYNSNTKEEIQVLLESKVFVKSKGGIKFSDWFIKETQHKINEVTVEELLKLHSIDPNIVGYQRIYSLKKKLLGDSKTSEVFSAESRSLLKTSPYVRDCTARRLVFHDIFYNEAHLLNGLNIDEILKIFEIDVSLIDKARIIRLENKLKYHNPVKASQIEIDDALRLRINKRKVKALEIIVEDNFSKIRSSVSNLSAKGRKDLCLWIQDFPLGKHNSRRNLLKKVNISKSSYYSILKDKSYITRANHREQKDLKDKLTIQKVIGYKGYTKGSRMIYMMMPRLTGIKMGRTKILRIMKKYKMTTSIRAKRQKPNIEKRKKKNLLNRKFRLARPLMHFVTDVSYLEISHEKIYLSCLLDSVTGKVISIQAHDAHDTVLMHHTLKDLPPAKKGALIHSDQGVLYMSDYYQSFIESLGYKQSMSRRGNCWDNAPIESFFGHFKDEVDITSITTLKDLQKELIQYHHYYNDERPQWTRKQMTPSAYETYLNEMNDVEFNEYLKTEQAKYESMMNASKKKAKKRAQDLGA